MSSKKMPLVVLGVATVLITILAITNSAAVSMNLFGSHMSVSEGLVMAASYILGIAFTLPLLFVRVASDLNSQKRLTEWQTQDNKLAGQVQSDREKQLEAKIATLETALQKALKR